MLPNSLVLYESGKESVASIDFNGVVTARSPGTAVITVSVVPIDLSDEDDLKTLKATCKVTVKPKMKGTSIKSLSRSSRAITVRWKKQTARVTKKHISGYQIQLATDRKFTKNKKTVTVKGYKNTSKKIRKLKGGRKYYVHIRTYKVLNGKKYYSSWSKIRFIKTRK